MELYFLRHGEAGKKEEWAGDDRERPLSVEGMERMRRVAARIASLDLCLEVIISSPLLGEYSGAKALMLVGHDPDFSRTIAACTGGCRLECKKGALARVDIADATGLRGTLLWLAPARLLCNGTDST